MGDGPANPALPLKSLEIGGEKRLRDIAHMMSMAVDGTRLRLQ